MKWENNVGYLISFFCGVLCCYLSLQFSYFEIKKELDVPSLIVSIITLLLGFFIAQTIQKKVTKNQNNHSFLINKIDKQWNSFNEVSTNVLSGNKIPRSTISSLLQNVVYPISFLRNLFTSFGISNGCLNELENKLEELEEELTNMPAVENIIDASNIKNNLEIKIVSINKCFVDIIKQIQNM